MADFIAYYRESTDGESGLGIVAGKFTEKIESDPQPGLAMGLRLRSMQAGLVCFSAPPPAPGQCRK